MKNTSTQRVVNITIPLTRSGAVKINTLVNLDTPVDRDEMVDGSGLESIVCLLGDAPVVRRAPPR